MEQEISESDECNVNEGAFWHTNMDLYYGYQPGEIVEVEHEPDKYWLAMIEYSYKHLVLLKWLGGYGEFWVDTASQSSTACLSNNFDEFRNPRRIFPPGHHLQSQQKSQFTLERPTKVLVKPSLYDPTNDPYASVETVDDLLKLEVDTAIQDAFGSANPNITSEHSASLVIAKCKTKIDYGQEDVDELEAALQSLDEIQSDKTPRNSQEIANSALVATNEAKTDQTNDNQQKADVKESPEKHFDTSTTREHNTDDNRDTPSGQLESDAGKTQSEEKDLNAHLDTCKSIQESAIASNRYVGLEDHCSKVFYLKPKQLFDIGGANHEKVLVPGTLLEVCHTIDDGNHLQLHHWFAVIISNTGGRLTLRWFLCDEPKFKQGRLELKTLRSRFVSTDNEDSEDCATEETKKDEPRLISPKEITFSMHFCDPCIHSISHAKDVGRSYVLPSSIASALEELNYVTREHVTIEEQQLEFIFDQRRMNLDKDRPIIDHILSTIRWKRPQYLSISFAPKDTTSPREVLISTPKTTKIMQGFVKRELEPGVYEIHSKKLADGTVIKFVYPYDSAYAVLPVDWAQNNADCLSVQPSRNPTPSVEGPENTKDSQFKEMDKPYEPGHIEPFELQCEIAIPANLDDTSTPCRFDNTDPQSWSRLIQSNQLKATNFHCSLDLRTNMNISRSRKFEVMDQLEVIHPPTGDTIYEGRIRKIVYPLLWIQISSDFFTVLPVNSTNIYPRGWAEFNNRQIVSLLPPRRKRNPPPASNETKRKKSKTADKDTGTEEIKNQCQRDLEDFDLGSMSDQQLDIDQILNEKSSYIRIYFNHKCFTGPSLSKGKICSLPQYVGPGPPRLVMEEVMTKIISVAYVPPRILNDLSSATFENLLHSRKLETIPMEFKAKYQKRTHLGFVQVCRRPEDIALYCEYVCEHLKCCYNLFGLHLYDGDDCPSHCRALTKSNKFMKRATYYREKARQGEFLADNSKKSTASNNNSSSNKSSRPRYNGRGSSESACSSVSRSDKIESRASSTRDEPTGADLKENLVAVQELENENESGNENAETNTSNNENESTVLTSATIVSPIATVGSGGGGTGGASAIGGATLVKEVKIESQVTMCDTSEELHNETVCEPRETLQPIHGRISERQSSGLWQSSGQFNLHNLHDQSPDEWTTEDVAESLNRNNLEKFRSRILSEGIDGQALLLLDRAAIREHFQLQSREFTKEELCRLCSFVEFVRNEVESRQMRQEPN